MSGEINVLSRTQIVKVNPVTKSVSVINAGPQGPGSGGGGGGGGPVDASDVDVADLDGNFTGDDVEEILAEIADSIAAIGGGGGGGGPSGPAPWWVASSTAPTSVKNAILAVGGLVCDGTADEVQLQAQLNTYGICEFVGLFNVAASIVVPTKGVFRGIGLDLSILRGAAALTSGGLVTCAASCENYRIENFSVLKGSAGALVDGVYSNVTSTSAFQYGAESKGNIHNLLISGFRYNLRFAGSRNNDSKISNITSKYATQWGIYLEDAADGMIQDCVVSSNYGPLDGTGDGFVVGPNCSQWHIRNIKAWFCRGDGIWIQGGRHIIDGLEGQDNSAAGVRLTGFFTHVSNILCDSNSYTSGDTFGWNGDYAGLEIGLWKDGSSHGGDDLNVLGVTSWDKNQASRGFNQKYGIRVKSGIRRFILQDFNTGNPAGTHHNITDGTLFDNLADISNQTNFIQGLNHGVKVASPPLITQVDFWAKNTVPTAITTATLTDIPTFSQALAASTFYAFEAFFEYLADAADGFQYQPTLFGATGSWEINYHVSGMADDIVCSTTVSTSKFSAAGHGLPDGTPVVVTGFTATTGIPVSTLLYVVGSGATAFSVARTINGTALTMGGLNDAVVTVSPVGFSEGALSSVKNTGIGGGRTKFRGSGDASDSSINRRVIHVTGVLYSGGAACTLQHKFAKTVASSANNGALCSSSWSKVRTL